MSGNDLTFSLRWTGDWPWYAGIGAALLLGVLAWMLYRRDVAGSNRALRILLPLLRSLAVFLIVLMLSGPVLHHRRVIGRLARLVLCVDASESMQLTDPAMDAGRKIAIARRLGLLDGFTGGLEMPQASAALADARAIADSLPPADSLDDTLWKKLSGEFSEKSAAAVQVLTQADAEAGARHAKDLAGPARELAAREFRAVNDRARAATELAQLGESAGRWSLQVSELFAKRIESDPAAGGLRSALAKFDAMPRWQRLQALLLESHSGRKLLDALAKQHDLQLVALDGATVKPLWTSGGREATPPPGLPKPIGDTTNLAAALKSAAGDESGAGKGAVVLFTDGQHNVGEAPLEAARVLAGREMAVFSVGFGSQVPPRDIALLRAAAPDSVFFEDSVRGELYLKEDLPAGEPFTVSVKDAGKVVWEKAMVSLGKGARRVPFEFPIKDLTDVRSKAAAQGYERSGATVHLSAEVSNIEGDRELANNSAPIRFRAVTQKRKILILDGRPRWETRYLRNLFERDEKWEVNTVIAGSTPDAGILRGEKSGTFPSGQKLLDAHDIIIFGEFPRGLLRDEELKWIADFVAKRGGAITFIDGSRGALRGYAGTPLEPLLPVEWAGPGVRTGVKSLQPAGRGASIGAFLLADDAPLNAETWSRLPVPAFIAEVKPLPGAEVLLEADTSGGKIPAAVLRPFGAGRVYYHAFDESWRWRYEIADQYHVQFWNQIADYTAEAPFAARDKYVQLDAGQLNYQPGDHAEIRVRLRDSQGRPVSDSTVSAVLFRDGQRVATVPLTPDDGGLYRGRTPELAVGSYEVGVDTAAVPPDQLKARTQFNVAGRDSIERSRLGLNEDLLRQIAVAGGGEYLREEQCDRLIDRLAPLSEGSVQEGDTVLWQSWWWFLPIVLLLTVEWILRKRAGML